jgi:hypothetical protein
LIVLATIAAALTANIALLAARYASSHWLAVLIALSFGLTSPLLPFSLLIFPEVTAALFITYAARRLLEPANRPWQWFIIGTCAAALPWLHYRLAPICVALALIAARRYRRSLDPRSLAAALATPVVSASLLLWWYDRLYGRPLPPAADHAGFSGLAGTLNGLAGTFFDQQWGAFIHNPLLLASTAAFIPFARTHKSDAAALTLVALPYLILTASYRVWWGEWNPPARYLTDVVPLFAVPLAWWLSRVRPAVRWTTFALVLIPAAAIMLTFVADPQRMYNHPDGTSQLFETWHAWSGIDLTDRIPSYVFYSSSPRSERIIFALLGLAVLGTLTTAARHLLPDPSDK